MFCSQCGKENPEHANFCFSCGSPMTLPKPIRPRRPARLWQSKTVMVSMLVSGVVGSGVYQVVASSLFPWPANADLNWPRSYGAGLVGAGFAALGLAVGRLIERAGR